MTSRSSSPASTSGDLVDEAERAARGQRRARAHRLRPEPRSWRSRRSISSRGATRYPTDEVLLQLRQQGQYVSVEPQPDGAYQILAAAPLSRCRRANDELGFVQAKFPLEQRLEHARERRARQLQPGEGAHVSAHGAEVQLHADVEPRAA